MAGIPGAIAKKRGHPNTEAIRICGWCSLVLWPVWLVAIIWAHTGPKEALRFRVSCADRSTGREFVWECQAGTAQEAEAKAQQMGYLVTGTQPVDE